MSGNEQNEVEVGSPSEVELESIRQKMESNWAGGEQSQLEKFLSGTSKEFYSESGRQWFVELVRFEIELQRRFGRSPSTTDYHTRFPHMDAEVLEDLIAFPMLPPPATLVENERLPGRYRKTSKIGQGGLGQVWRVVDRHMNRELAIKTCNDRMKDRPIANERLQREALLTGSLQHPGVPPVFDHGVLNDGSEYFSMKLVDGKTLAEILADRSGTQAELSHLIGVFEQITQTVAYAHSVGVVHRDLKPQNIMVGAFGEVQVMDWGMGKRIGIERSPNAVKLQSKVKPNTSNFRSGDTAEIGYDSSFADPMKSMTETGEVFGTPAYMAPEQAQGNIDAIGTYTDVFSLGSILFEILTNSRVYENVDATDVLSMAAQGDLADSPERLEKSNVDTGLIEICKKCLHAEPVQRFQDASHVAEAITKYQDGVQARLRKAEVDRKSAEVKAGEEKKRRRTAIWLSSIIALTFAVGLAGVLWQLNNAIAAKTESDKNAKLADERFLESKRAVDEYFTEVSNSKDLLASTPGTEKLRRKLLEKAQTFYVSFVELKPDDPVLKDELAKSYLSLGKIIQELGSESESDPYFKDCIQICQELIDNGHEQPETKKRILACHNAMTANLATSGKIKEAIESGKSSLDLAIELANEHPDDVHSLCSVPRTQFNITQWAMAIKQPSADEFLEDAVLRSKELMAQFPQSETAANTRALVLSLIAQKKHDEAHRLGIESFHTGRRGETDQAAEMKQREKELRLEEQALMHEAFDIMATQLELNADQCDLKPAVFNDVPAIFDHCATRLSLAYLYAGNQKDPVAYKQTQKKAAGIVRDAMDRISKYSDQNPYLLKERLMLIKSHQLLGIMTSLDERIGILKDAMELTQKEITKHPEAVRLYQVFNDLGSELVRWEKGDQANLTTYEEMLEASQILRKLSGEDALDVVKMVVKNHSEIGSRCRKLGQPEKAISNYANAIALLEDLDSKGKLDKATRVLLAKTHHSYALALSKLDHPKEAITQALASVEIFKNESKGDSNSVEFFEQGRSLSRLAWVYLNDQQFEQAIETADESQRFIQDFKNKRYDGMGKYILLELHETRAKAFEKLGQLDASKSELERMLELPSFGFDRGSIRTPTHTKFRIHRVDILAGNLDEALKETLDLLTEEFESGKSGKTAFSNSLLDAASSHALAAKVALTKNELDDEQKNTKVSELSKSSIELIQKALDKNEFHTFYNVDDNRYRIVLERIRDDEDFGAVRDRQEFKELIANLESSLGI